MQVEIDGVDRHRSRKAADQAARDALEGIARHQTAGAAARPQQRHEFVARSHVGMKPDNREAGAGEPLDHVGAVDQRRAVAVAGEVGEIRLSATKQLVS